MKHIVRSSHGSVNCPKGLAEMSRVKSPGCWSDRSFTLQSQPRYTTKMAIIQLIKQPNITLLSMCQTRTHTSIYHYTSRRQVSSPLVMPKRCYLGTPTPLVRGVGYTCYIRQNSTCYFPGNTMRRQHFGYLEHGFVPDCSYITSHKNQSLSYSIRTYSLTNMGN